MDKAYIQYTAISTGGGNSTANHTNSSCFLFYKRNGPGEFSENQLFAYCSILFSSLTVKLLVNSLLAVALWKTKQAYNASLKLILWVSLTDVINCLFSIPRFTLLFFRPPLPLCNVF